MLQDTRLKITELNPHLICVLCGGYYIDATTITECLHSFCKTCIVQYLETAKYCPVCETLVHKTKPLLRIRADHTLQDLVYKLVPGLFKDEMEKRRKFYQKDIDSGKLSLAGCTASTQDGAKERIIFSQEENISLALELSPDGRPPYNPTNRSKHKLEPADRRYLLCPASLTVGLLKKFVRTKFSLCDRYQVDLFHTDETLKDSYTLIDVAYIYQWRRVGPLRLYYTVYTNPAKRFKPQPEQEPEVVPMETNSEELTDGVVSEKVVTKPELLQPVISKPVETAVSEPRESLVVAKPALMEPVVSEPVVTSTQNSQACQTEPPVENSVDSNIKQPDSTGVTATADCKPKFSTADYKPKVETAEVSCETKEQDFPEQPSHTGQGVQTVKSVQACQTVPCDVAVNTMESVPTQVVDQSVEVQTQTMMSYSVSDFNSNSSTCPMTPRSSPKPAQSSAKSSPPKSPVRSLSCQTSPVKALPTELSPNQDTEFTVNQNQSKDGTNKVTLKISVTDTSSKKSGTQTASSVSSTTSRTPVYKQSHHVTSSIPNPKAPTPSYAAPKTTQPHVPRPRGRPPKNRSPGDPSTAANKHKNHSQSSKSRSQSPRRHKHGGHTHRQSAQEFATNYASSLNSSYTPVSYQQQQQQHHHHHHHHHKESKHSSHSSKNDRPEELKIPKQIVCFTNGQYTLTSVSSKLSSPLSPTKTVSESQQVHSYGDRHSKSEKSEHKSQSPKQTSNSTSTPNHGNNIDSNHGNNQNGGSGGAYSSNHGSYSRNSSQGSSRVSYHGNSQNSDRDNNQKTTRGSNKETGDNSTRDTNIDIARDMTRDTDQGKNPNSENNHSSHSGSKHLKDIDNRAKASKPTDADGVRSPVLPAHESSPYPVYKHTSPYFTSINMNRISTTRPHTHLNIPNLSYLHHANSLYSLAGRNYVAERLNSPIHRSPPVTTGINSDIQIQQRHYAQSNNNPSVKNGSIESPPPMIDGSVSPVSVPVTSYHYVTSLQLEEPSTDTNKLVSLKTEPVNGMSNKNIFKATNGNRKGKEKSIHHIISALNERRTKKETQPEQLNGIDLSTRSPQAPEGRQSVGSTGSSGCNGEVDKFAFTDDEEMPMSPQRLHFKPDIYQPERKSAV